MKMNTMDEVCSNVVLEVIRRVGDKEIQLLSAYSRIYIIMRYMKRKKPAYAGLSGEAGI